MDDWMGLIFVSVVALVMLAILGLIGGGIALEVACYRSGNPDSMPCFMMHGSSTRVNANVNVK